MELLQNVSFFVNEIKKANELGIFGSRFDGSTHITSELFEKLVEENQVKVKLAERSCSQFPIECSFSIGNEKYYAIYSINEFLYRTGGHADEQSTSAV